MSRLIWYSDSGRDRAGEVVRERGEVVPERGEVVRERGEVVGGGVRGRVRCTNQWPVSSLMLSEEKPKT